MARRGSSSELEEWAKKPTDADRIRAEAEREIAAARSELRDSKALLKLERQRAELAEKRAEVALAIGKPQRVRAIKPRKGKKSNESTAVAIASDWHVGEHVDPKTINDRNAYDPDVASARAERFFQSLMELVQLSRAGTRIDNLVLGLLGDMITGYIHEELEESNTMSPIEEVLFAGKLIRRGIDFLLEHGEFSRIVIPCNYGNHGRTTKKRRVSTAAANSFEWMLYHILAEHYSGESRVQFQIADGAHLYLDVYDKRIRFHHGDDIRYWGGVGGLHTPMRKAIDAWDEFEAADLTVIGHYHQLLFGKDYVVNGSLIGWAPFALSVKARFEIPQQAFFLMHAEHGRTICAPIHVL